MEHLGAAGGAGGRGRVVASWGLLRTPEGFSKFKLVNIYMERISNIVHQDIFP